MAATAKLPVDAPWCSEFEMREEVLEEDDLEFIQEKILKPGEPRLVSLSAGWLGGWHRGDKVCNISTDTYLVARFEGGRTQVIGVIRYGFALQARIDTLGGDHILSVFHLAGASQFALEPYRFIVGDHGFERIERVEVEGHSHGSFTSSNMSSVGVHGDRVVVKNFIRDGKPGHEVSVRSYRYQGGKFIYEGEQFE